MKNKKKESTPKEDKKDQKIEKYSVEELAAQNNIANFVAAGIFIKNGINLSKKLGEKEFKKLMSG